MKVCHIITSFGFGGAERLLVDLLNIQSATHEVHVVYLKGGPELYSFVINPVKLHHVELGLDCALKLRSLIKEIKPDIVHTHLGHADLVGFWACRGLNIKRFCTMHNIWFKWNWKDYVIFSIYALLLNTVARNCRIIAISKAVFEHIKNRLLVSSSRIKLIYNAIPHLVIRQNKDALRQELGINANSFCVLFVGRLEIQKSVDTLLFAVQVLDQQIHNLKVYIVGNGTLKPALERQAAELGIDNKVIFAGTTGEVEKYFASCDVFVLPSIFEGFGIVIIEAFRASLPVIATNIEGPLELIQDNHNGMLFPPKNFHSLAKKILELYKSNVLRDALGKCGYESYLNKYDIKMYAEQIETLYLK